MIAKSKLFLLNPLNLLLDLSSKKKRILFLTFLIITFLLSSTIANAPGSKESEIQNKYKATSDDVELVGRWPYGACVTSAVDTTRNIALIGNGYALQVLDISTPSSLSKIGEIELEGLVQDIVISGNYAYVITLSYLKIIDISDLNNPNEVGSEYFEDDILQSVAIWSDYVYVASRYYAGLFIYDVSNPNNPSFQALYPSRINDVAIWEHNSKIYAICDRAYWPGYLAGLTHGVEIIDVSNPSDPRLAGTYQTEASYNLQGIDVSGDGYVYTCQYSDTDETSKIAVIDVVTDPTNPTEVGSYVESERDFEDVTLSGTYAYFCGSRYGKLVIMDISTPSSPYDVGECDIPHGCHDMDISGSFVGIPYGSGFSLIDVSDPGSPSRLGNYDTPGGVPNLGTTAVASGDYVYMSCGSRGLRIMDVSDPSNPFVAGTCDDISSRGGLAVSGRFAYCMDGGWPRRLNIVDISSPTSPFLVTYLAFPSDTYNLMDVAVQRNYAYVSGNKWISGETWDFLTVVDISNPLDPSIMGFYDCPVKSLHLGGIALSGNYAYLSLTEFPYVDVQRAGLRVIDISDPTNPTEVGYYFSGEEYTATTDSEGRYSHSVSNGWSGTAIPSMTGYVFSPSSRTYSDVDSDQIDQDYTATVASTNILSQLAGSAPRSKNISPQETSATGNLLREAQPAQPTISGVVKTEEGTGIEGVTIIFADAPSGLAHDVVVRGNYAYLAGGAFRIIDISNPENPREVYYYPYYLETNSSVALSGDYAYLGNLSIFNISYPYDPAGPWRYYGEGGEGLAVSGNYIYVPGSLSILKNLLAPEVSITNPSALSTVHDSVSVEVQASHSSGIGSVEFYIDDELRSVDNTSTYSYTWDTNSIADGPHKIKAWAYNGNGTSSDSEIEVTVRNHMNLNINSTAGGATDPATGTYSYDYGIEVTITANPNSGYRFSGWTGDVPGGHENDNPMTIAMDSDRSITANFTKEEEKKAPCFIATAAYGSPLHPHVDVFRDLRDKYLIPSKLGRLLVELYYGYSPHVADFIAKHKSLKVAVRISLLPLVAFSYSLLHFGPIITAVMLLFIFGLPVFPILFFRGKMRQVEAKSPEALVSRS